MTIIQAWGCVDRAHLSRSIFFSDKTPAARMKGAEPSKETLTALVAYVRSLPNPTNWQLNEDGTPSSAATPSVQRGFALFIGDGGVQPEQRGRRCRLSWLA
ncbi:hypothetical protein ACQR2D_23095 [Bradyrhizobium sp. HKCCYLRH2057]|uniref:hypothetical protein n=1 Tax=unclassified Bradyrhizobium TaxID=2631580 RepID=UPI003EBE6F54